MPDETAFNDLLRLGTPRCEAKGCRRNGSVAVKTSQTPDQKPRTSMMCPRHAPVLAEKARALGWIVTL